MPSSVRSPHLPTLADCIRSTGLLMVLGSNGCGTTVIAQQPGHEWCVEVQGPHGSVSDPDQFDEKILEFDAKDPRGYMCFSTTNDALMDAGIHAEKDGLPLPPGYEALRDVLVAAARLRCTELALAEQPPLMFTDCLSAPVSTPYPLSETETCTICVETSVWSDAKHEVECPPGLDDTDEGDGTTTEPPGTSGGSADDTGEGGGAVFDCAAWAPEASITSAYYASGRPEGWYHVMHAGLLESLVESGFAPTIACDQGRYLPHDDGTWVFAHVTAGDLLWILGVRSGYQSARLRAYDPVTHAGTTAWIPIESIDGALAAYDVLLAYDHLELAMLDPTGPDRIERHVFIEIADCTTPSGVQCPPP